MSQFLRVLLLLAVIAPATLFAQSPWDGQHGDLNVFTMSPSAAALPGLPWAGVFVITEIFVSSTDQTVSAFRVNIRYTDATGQHDQSVIAPIVRTGVMAVGVFLGLDSKQINGVTITKMRDIETLELPLR